MTFEVGAAAPAGTAAAMPTEAAAAATSASARARVVTGKLQRMLDARRGGQRLHADFTMSQIRDASRGKHSGSAAVVTRVSLLPALPVSVLDLVPVGEGIDPSASVAASIDHARRADELGFTRYWLAEHHNMPGIASSAPPVHDRGDRRRHRAHPGRLGRRDAAQPSTAGGRRAVRHARRAVPGPHRPRPGPRAGYRPVHRPGAAARGDTERRRLPRPARRAGLLPRRRVARRASVRAHRGGTARRRAAGDLAARAPRSTAPNSPACSACRSRSRTISARPTRCRRSSATARRSVPPASWTRRTRW